MIINALKMVVLGVAFSMSAAGTDNNKRVDEDRCMVTSDLRMSDVKVDIDRNGESEIQGKIVNEAGDVDYKNVKVRINFLDDDGEQIGSRVSTIKGDFADGSSEPFTLKFNAPEGTEHASYNIECAVRD